MDMKCVTRNLGRWPASQQWVDANAAAKSWDILFLQEIPAPSGIRVPAGYHAFPRDLQPQRDRGHCRSVILVAEAVLPYVQSSRFVLPEVLDDYVAEVVVCGDGRAPLTLVCVHASPKALLSDEAPHTAWRRDAEVRIFYSDVITGELAALATDGHRVLAAGDFNEAMSWDPAYRTTTSAEFFGRLGTHGFRDVTASVWDGEVTTQTRHPYQVDRIFATADVEVALEPHETSLGPNDGLSDHLPISFTLTV
jgi:hypothetical protein